MPRALPASHSAVDLHRNEIAEALRDAGLQAGTVGDGRLSMGMSGDFELAVEGGSTCVRVGRAIFGRRPTPGPHRPDGGAGA